MNSNIAALTNIVSALLLNPEISDRIVIVWLGGNALDWPDNREFNCRQDVTAACVVFLSGAPLVILPCKGVVSAFTTTGPELEYWLKGKNPLCDYLVRHTIETANTYAKGKVWSRAIWDVATVGWLLDSDGTKMKDKLISKPVPGYNHHYELHASDERCKYVYYIHRDELFSELFRKLKE